ncbi:hypothetical protein [Alkalinema sp. FACHB-956]|uniref:hypothetical protein n=1 Tax=Alkalinema sp. FACHB-956 TaxID=2692768 RepID=UPI0016840F0E|nr:hypothetical protein [Alkalinema sp. FACHB-956]MBD2329633.1 hypothetical protein [Alkalinema sp. FACHB-956]
MAPTVALANPVVSADAQPSNIFQLTTAQQAVQKIQALPEIQAWQQYITEKSLVLENGKNIRPVLRVEPRPVEVAGKSYWLVHFLESHAIHDHHWQSFWVSLHDEGILADDTSGKYLDLDTWRKQTNPMRRIRQTVKLKDGTYIGRGLDDYLEVDGDRCRLNLSGAVHPWRSPCDLIQIDADRIYDGYQYWHRL